MPACLPQDSTQAGDFPSSCMEVSFVSYCNLVRLPGGTLLVDLLVIPGTMLSVLPKCGSMARAPCAYSTLTSWWSGTCTGWTGPINSLVLRVRAYICDVWTHKIGGSPPACPRASSSRQTLQSWCGHPHLVMDSCSCRGHPIPLAPKREG